MYNLNYFEKIAEKAIFSAEEKKITAALGNDSLAIRMSVSNKKNFTDTTKVANFEKCK